MATHLEMNCHGKLHSNDVPMSEILALSRILIIGISTSPLGEHLQADGYVVETQDEVETGLVHSLSGQFQLVIFHLPFARFNGLEALRRVRRQSLLPILMVSPEGNETERVLALELGADDYLCLPCSPTELLARVRTILRRAHTGVSVFGQLVKANSLELNRSDYRVRYGQEEIPLTTAEFELLEYLAKRAGQILEREELTQQILGRPFNPQDRSIDVHISNLRKKLAATEACKIRAIRGVGYQFLLK